MKTLERLRQIESHLSKAQNLLLATINSENMTGRTVPGRPDPDVTQRVAWHIAQNWPRLAKLAEFTFRDAKELVKGDSYCRRRSDSAFSSILSNWARDGYLTIVTPGSGPTPTKYKVKKQ